MNAFSARKISSSLVIALAVASLLSGCGGGGGNRAAGVEPGPDEPGGPVEPPPPIVTPPQSEIDTADIGADDQLTAVVSGLSFNSPLTLTFSVTANGNQSVTGISTDNANFSMARLIDNAGDSAGQSWVSYILNQEDPICRDQADIDDSTNQCSSFTTDTDPATIADSARKVQDTAAIGKVVTDHASYESSGELVDNEDGSFSYTYSVDIGEPADRSELHRACIQFSFNASIDNLCVDFIPAAVADDSLGLIASSLQDGFYDDNSARQIATEASCNSCHDKLAIHGGGRTGMDYCVSCHNPDSVDANSGNSVDMKVLVHKLHNGRNLPSVADDGGSYKIFGYRNGEHDYSNLSYPQKVINCSRCHAGQEDIDFATAQGLPMPEAEITADGHDWVSNPTLAACSSCHEKLLDGTGINGDPLGRDHSTFTDETNCAGCHRDRGADEPGGLQANQAHRNLFEENADSLSLHIDSVSNLGAGEFPVINFHIQRDGSAIDIKDSAAFDGKLKVGVAWDAASDFDNDGISGFDSLNIELDGIGDSSALGENLFTITSPTAVTADQDTVALMLFGHEETEAGKFSPIISEVQYYASTASSATARREVADIDKCNSCHHRLAMTDTGHAGYHAAPANNLKVCNACHGPGLGFGAGTPTDYRVLIHGVHAGGMRETPYKDADKYGPDVLQFPGDLADCESCHLAGTHTLLPSESPPLKSGIGKYRSPIAATCASCHDTAIAQAHMESAGGAAFDTDFDTADVTESCNVCHGPGKDADVDNVHNK